MPFQAGGTGKEERMEIIKVIKYEGDTDCLVWKYPYEDFNTFSQLIVNESQEAILFKDGQALDRFTSGKYTMHTGNIPLLNKIVNLPSGGESPFHCTVCFINKAEKMQLLWGVGGINYSDPNLNNYTFVIGTHGELSLTVTDSRKLLIKLVGTGTELTAEQLSGYFRTAIATHVKTILPTILKANNTSIFDVESDLTGLSDVLKEKISAELDNYGVSLERFWIDEIIKPENDPVYRKINQQRGDRVIVENQGEIDLRAMQYETQIGLVEHSGIAQKAKMDIDVRKYEKDVMGEDWLLKLRQYDVMDKVAENEGSGSDLRNMAMGVGVGFGVGGSFGSAFADIASSTMGGTNMSTMPPVTAAVNQQIPEMINLQEEQPVNPSPVGNPTSSFEEKVKNLTLMKNAGLLSDEEFEAEKAKLLELLRG